jgi:hypothetical protein
MLRFPLVNNFASAANESVSFHRRFRYTQYVPRYHSLGSHCTSPISEESFWVFCFLDHLSIIKFHITKISFQKKHSNIINYCYFYLELFLSFLFRLVRIVVKCVYYLRYIRSSVCLSLHLSMRLPRDGLSWNFILKTFLKKSVEKTLDLVKVGQTLRPK